MPWPARPIIAPEFPTSPGSIRVTVAGAGADYQVFVGQGLLARLPALLREHCPAHRYVVIADHKVAELHGAALMSALAGVEPQLLTFPSGEWNKTREQWADLSDRMLKAGIGRDGAVLAFGGGVAGDLAGFVAATWLRGIPVVQLPTSLLAMIDSSIGGKTGLDVPGAKNMIGAFHQPRLVVADIGYLATLPRAHIAAGLAEAIKHGVIRDAGYFQLLGDATPCLARDLGHLEAVVRRSIEIKAAVVAADERETGVRAILNFGHTVGHAVEALSGFDLLHGEAVAIGMAVEAGIAEAGGLGAAGLRATIVATLERYSLPSVVPAGLTSDAILELMHTDKKARGGRMRLALPRDIGTMAQSGDGAWTVEADAAVIRQALDSSR